MPNAYHRLLRQKAASYNKKYTVKH